MQDQRISDLEDHVTKIEARLELGNKRFEHDTERVDVMELSMKDAVQVIIETLQALTVHAIDGNNIEDLKTARKQLTDYLLKR
jgi:pimeloyl-CoA synthetase